MNKKKICLTAAALVAVGALVLCVYLIWSSGLRMETLESIELSCGETVTAYELVKQISRHEGVELSLEGKGTLTENNRCISFPQAGDYTVTVKASVGASSVSVKTLVHVLDTDPPQLICDDFAVVLGEAPDYLAHVEAWDEQDGNLTNSIKIDSSQIQLDKVGRYEVTYSVTDLGGNTTTDTAMLTIKPAPASDISLSEGIFWLAVNEYEQLSASVLPLDWEGEIVWSTSDPSVCVVNDGLVYCKGVGSCTITATADEISASCTVYGEYPSASTLWLNQSTMELDKGQICKLTVRSYPSNWGGSVTWRSSDPSVASVDEQGLVTWQGRGECTITVSAEGGASDSCTVTCIGKTWQDSIWEWFGGTVQSGDTPVEDTH